MEKAYSHEEAIACMNRAYQIYEDTYQGLVTITGDNSAFKLIIDKDEDDNYYLVIRGTLVSSLKDLIVDIEVFRNTEFPFPVNTDLNPEISFGILDEFRSLVPKLRVELNNLPDRSNLFITGHSQGGAMCALFHIWLETFVPDKFYSKSYAFAPPSIGNADFAALAEQKADLGIYRVVNPLDLIPYAFADLPTALKNNIPTSLPFLLKGFLYATHYILKMLGRSFSHVGQTIILEKKPLYSCTNAWWESLFYSECEILAQHDPSHYVEILDM